jgi:hypothetical protein
LLLLRLRLPRFLRLLLLLLLLLRCARLLRCAIASPAAAATATALLVVGCWLPVVGRRALLLLLLRTLLLLLALLSALGMRLLSARRALPSALFRPAIPLSRPRRLALAALLALLFRRAGLLLPFPQLLLHETALLRLGARTRLVVSAVRAALPTFWIRLLAMRAEDALRERHSKSLAVYPERSEGSGAFSPG